MSKKPFFLDFRNVELPNIDAWSIITLPIRLLGRVAIDSCASTNHSMTKDVLDDTKSAFRPSSNSVVR